MLLSLITFGVREVRPTPGSGWQLLKKLTLVAYVVTPKNGAYMTKRLVGVPWFNEAEYGACRALMADAELLPIRYSDWLDRVREEVAEILGEGKTPFKVLIEPTTFTVWCRERMLARDQVSRKRYAAIVAFQNLNAPR